MTADQDLRLTFINQFAEAHTTGVESPHDKILVTVWRCMCHQYRLGAYQRLDLFQVHLFIKTDAGSKGNREGAADTDKGNGSDICADSMYRDTIGKGCKQVIDPL